MGNKRRNKVTNRIIKITKSFYGELLDGDNEKQIQFLIGKVNKFLSDLNSEFDGAFIDKTLFLNSNNVLKVYPDQFENELRPDLIWIDMDGISFFMMFDKEMKYGFINEKFLNMSEYGFYANYESVNKRISQGYDYGEYDTGWFSPYPPDDQEQYIIKENLDEYEEALKIFQKDKSIELQKEEEQKKSYEIEELKGPFGYRREGGGIVIYMFTENLDYDAVKQVVEYAYYEYTVGEDGEKILDWAQYDPSILRTKIAGDIEDEWTLEEVTEMINGKDSATTKFEMLITKEILAKDIPLIFIDSDKNKIFQLDEGSFKDIIKKYKDELSIFIREYDHVYDY